MNIRHISKISPQQSVNCQEQGLKHKPSGLLEPTSLLEIVTSLQVCHVHSMYMYISAKFRCKPGVCMYVHCTKILTTLILYTVNVMCITTLSVQLNSKTNHCTSQRRQQWTRTRVILNGNFYCFTVHSETVLLWLGGPSICTTSLKVVQSTLQRQLIYRSDLPKTRRNHVSQTVLRIITSDNTPELCVHARVSV